MKDVLTKTLDGFIPMTSWLWWLSITFFGIGDVMTTIAATKYTVIIEGSPFMHSVLQSYGLLGMLGIKFLSFGLGYLTWTYVPRPHNVGVPLAYAVIGVGVTTWNLFILAATASG